MVYEKGGLSVFKKFLFISQLFCCAFIKCHNNNCPRVCSIFNTMSRQREIIVGTKFCNKLETRSVKCRDIVRNVATLFMMLF